MTHQSSNGADLTPSRLVSGGITRRSALGAGAFGAMWMLAGCGGNGGQPTASQGPLKSPSTKPDKLVVRTWGDPWKKVYAEGPGAAFTQKTGIPVQFDTTDYNEMQAKVRTAVNAGQRPPVDVVLTIETVAFTAGVQNVASPLDTDLVSRFSELNKYGRPRTGSAYANVTSYSQPMVYAPDRVTIANGASINELWKPEYRNRVFVTSGSSQSLLLPVAKSLGINDLTGDLTPVWKRIAELKPNIAASGDEEEFISAVQRRQIDLGITLVASAREVPSLKWRVPSEGATLSFESLYVPAGLPKDVQYYANLFINEVLAPQAQSQLAEALGEVPTHPRSTLPDFMKGDPAFPFTTQEIERYALVVDPELFARNNQRWSAEYASAIAT